MTPTEYRLLITLAQHAGKVLTHRQLLKQVWGHNHLDGIRTIDVHIRWLRQKIESNPAQPHYIHTVRGIGYRFTDV